MNLSPIIIIIIIIIIRRTCKTKLNVGFTIVIFLLIGQLTFKILLLTFFKVKKIGLHRFKSQDRSSPARWTLDKDYNPTFRFAFSVAVDVSRFKPHLMRILTDLMCENGH